MFIAYAVLRTGLLPSKFMPELLLLIVCFCQSLLALAFLMSCFFSNAKLAAQVGGLAILLIYSPKFFMSADSFVLSNASLCWRCSGLNVHTVVCILLPSYRLRPRFQATAECCQFCE